MRIEEPCRHARQDSSSMGPQPPISAKHPPGPKIPIWRVLTAGSRLERFLIHLDACGTERSPSPSPQARGRGVPPAAGGHA